MTITVAPPTVTAADVLNQAADYLEEHGHCKHDLRDWEGRVCLLGALISIGQSSGLAMGYAAMSGYLGSDPVSWNNAPERTKGEVVAALRAAALLEGGRDE
jgi:hypothetical protein